MSAAFGFVQSAQSRSPSVFSLLSAPRVEPGRSRGGTGQHLDCSPRFLGCIGVFFSASVTVFSNVPGGRVAEMAMAMAMAMALAEGLLKEGHEHAACSCSERGRVGYLGTRGNVLTTASVEVWRGQ